MVERKIWTSSHKIEQTDARTALLKNSVITCFRNALFACSVLLFRLEYNSPTGGQKESFKASSILARADSFAGSKDNVRGGIVGMGRARGK
jgi:hypothetical protein